MSEKGERVSPKYNRMSILLLVVPLTDAKPEVINFTRHITYYKGQSFLSETLHI